MADTTFVDNVTVVPAAWLNDVNNVTYDLPDSADTAKGDALIAVKADLTGSVARTQHTKNADVINVNDFSGVDATGATSSTVGILAACLAAATAGKALRFSGSYKLSTTLALTSSHNGLKWVLDGATITKGASIDLVTMTSCDNFSIDGVGTIDGLMTSYTGRGFLLSGTCCNFYVGPGIVTKAFASAHFEFGQNAGSYAKLMNTMLADASQTTPEMILKSGATDSGAMQRRFSGHIQGHITLTGALATFINCPLVNYISIDDNCAVTIVNGTSWSNNGVAIPTISGAGTIITGCRFSDNVTLGSGMSGAFVGNAQNGGTFTDSTTGGNCNVYHHPLAQNYHLINKCFLPLTAFEVQAYQIDADWGDSSPTFDPLSYKPIMAFRTPLTTNRTITLSTTGARGGQVVKVVREAAATGASTLSVGGLKSLAVSQWCEVVYDGNTSSWRLIAFGSL